MFETVEATNPDAILALMLEFRQDPRADKVDLGIGIYRDHLGQTPIMQAIHKAEQKLLQTQTTKAYVSPTGDAVFCEHMRDLVLGSEIDSSRVKAVQSPGGSGALRILGDLVHLAAPGATTWIPDPTWPNHRMLLAEAGHNLATYPYYDTQSTSLTFDAMISTLSAANQGDIVVIHGCCHNPTGADLDLEQWRAIGELCNERGLFPFIDLAYQGFGDGLEADAQGTRLLASMVPELVIATSCSKNFALYRERTGAAMLMAKSSEDADRTLSRLSSVIRSNYSMPPDHGASVTREVLSDDVLKKLWMDELETMRLRMQNLRVGFSDALRKRSNSDRFDYIARQKGMFSRLPLDKDTIDTLRLEHGVYMVGDGRINIAGLPDDNLDALAETIISALPD